MCCRIPRDVPGPASTQTAGTFVFIINEDASRRSHLIYTLGQFTRPSPETGFIPPEEKLLKRYIDSRKKEYLEFAKQNESATNGGIEFKQTSTRITIEGEHVCLFVIKRTNQSSPVDGVFINPALDANQHKPIFEVQITPILNAPYQLS